VNTIRARIRAIWRRIAEAVIADDPHEELSRLDRLDGRH
jgi:hypothetical protein